MCTKEKIQFTRVRKVKVPFRAHSTDAGIDFFFPEDIRYNELKLLNSKANGIDLIKAITFPFPDNRYTPSCYVLVKTNFEGIVEKVCLLPHTRVFIPSGIKVLISPKESMLIAENKSGISISTGIIVGADVVDSAYTGEIGIHIINTSSIPVVFSACDKLVQFIHTPVYLSKLEEIGGELYEVKSQSWGTRGSNGFGSGHIEDDSVINSDGETSC